MWAHYSQSCVKFSNAYNRRTTTTPSRTQVYFEDKLLNLQSLTTIWRRERIRNSKE